MIVNMDISMSMSEPHGRGGEMDASRPVWGISLHSKVTRLLVDISKLKHIGVCQIYRAMESGWVQVDLPGTLVCIVYTSKSGSL